MSTQLKIKRSARAVLVGQVVFPPRAGGARRAGFSQHRWRAVVQNGNELIIQRGGDTQRLSGGIEVLTLVSEDPNLS